MDIVLDRETIVKSSKLPVLPESTLKIIIGNPKFFVPRPQKPEIKNQSASSSIKNKRADTDKMGAVNQPVVTNKYSIALLTAPKVNKVIEPPVQEKKVQDVEDVWKVRHQDEVWNFNSIEKAYRFVCDNFGDVKGVCVENIRTGVLYTKNKFIELFGDKAQEKNDKPENPKPQVQPKNHTISNIFNQQSDESDPENDYPSNYDKSNNRIAEQNKERIIPQKQQQPKDVTQQYGDYNIWRNKNMQIPDNQRLLEYQGQEEAVYNKPNIRQQKEVQQVNQKYRVEAVAPNKDVKTSRYDMFQRQEVPSATDKNRYQKQTNEKYGRQNIMSDEDMDYENEYSDKMDFRQNNPKNEKQDLKYKKNISPKIQAKNESMAKNIFDDLSHKHGQNNNFIELEKLLDAFNVIDHDTFLLELRRYISVNKLTDIGFNVPNPSKNIDFQIDIDNSDNEIEHKMTQIQIDQCINKLLSEYIKSNISHMKKVELKNKPANNNRKPKAPPHNNNDFIITKVLDEESIKRLLQREEINNRNNPIVQNTQEYQGYQGHQEYAQPKQRVVQNQPNKYTYEQNRNAQPYNQHPSQQEYHQTRYQQNNYNKYAVNEISKIPKGPNNAPRPYNNMPTTERVGNRERGPNNPGNKNDQRPPKDYPVSNYKHY